MPRKFSTAVLDTLLKTVEVEFKVPLLGFGEIKFPVSEHAKDWWKNEKAREELLEAIDIAEQKFVAQHPDNKAAQILRDFSLKNEEEFQKVIAEILNHLDEQKITWLMADKLGKGFESIVSNKELQDALNGYIPILRNELGKIREFREVISYLLQKQIANTTSLTYETTKEIKGLIEQDALIKSAKLRIEKTVFISYRRTNLPWALAIFQNLKSEGYDVFFDYLSIPSGDFENIIVENIKARAHFVVILTPSALERCNEPRDWLRREIETAMDEKRNIIPLMLESFDFGSPSTVKALTGKLEKLKKYNGLRLHSEYFFEGMDRLRNQFLNVSLDTVIHPISEAAKPVTEEHQTAASDATPVEKEQLTAQEWFERGFVFLEAGNNSDAIRCCTEAINLSPEFSAAYFVRGLAHAFNNDLNKAIKDYDKSIQFDQNTSRNAVDHYFRGEAYMRKGDLEKAFADYDETIRLKPDFAQPYFNRGLIHRENKDFQGALADFNEAIRLYPDFPEAYLARGVVCGGNNDFQSALVDFNEAIRLKPDFDKAYFFRGIARRANQDFQGAIADFNEAIRLKLDFADAYFARALIWEEKKKYSSAIEDYQKYLELGNDISNNNKREAKEKIKSLKSKLTKKKPKRRN